jgi:hypothetical protein
MNKRGLAGSEAMYITNTEVKDTTDYHGNMGSPKASSTQGFGA